MRIVHLADVHIGVENFGKTDPETGLSTRLGDFLRSFDEAVDYAIETNADLVLCCGDAYKSRDPSQTHQREFAHRLVRLSSAGIPTFLVVGNHDLPAVFGRATALEIFQTLEVPKVYVGDRLTTYRVPTASGDVQIVAVPWPRRSELLARRDTRGLTPDQVNEAIQEMVSRLIRAQVEALDPAVPSLLAGHVTVSGAKVGSEQSMMLGRDPVLLKSDVALPQLDYVALGHIHRHQVLNEAPHIVYSGSLERVDFGEERDEKGFCVLELDPQRRAGDRLQSFEFRRVNARRFVTVDVEVRSGDVDPTRTVIDAISSRDVTDAIVRVRITVPAEQDRYLRESDIRDALSGAHFVASIAREVSDRHRSRLGPAYEEGRSPRRALEAYFEERGFTKERSDLLMRHAELLMAELESE